MTARIANLPADPAERRRLWQTWRTDAPTGDPPTTRASAVSASVRRVRDAWVSEVIDAPESVIAGLRRAIADSMTGNQLTLDDRQRLIARAERLGLTRFEANLLIAAVLHRHGSIAPAPVRHSNRTGSVAQWIAFALLAEIALVAAVVIIFR